MLKSRLKSRPKIAIGRGRDWNLYPSRLLVTFTLRLRLEVSWCEPTTTRTWFKLIFTVYPYFTPLLYTLTVRFNVNSQGHTVYQFIRISISAYNLIIMRLNELYYVCFELTPINLLSNKKNNFFINLLYF